MKLRRFTRWDPWALLLIIAYLIHGLIYIPNQSITTDEWDHYSYASRFARFQPDKIKPFDDASCMPVTVVNCIPRIVRQVLHPGYKSQDGGVQDIIAGRYITLIACLLLGLILYRWASGWYGRQAGRVAVFFFAFCPNFISQAGLVGTDAFACLATALCVWCFSRFRQQPDWKSLIAFSSALALAQITKQSLTWLYVLFPLMLLLPGPRPGKKWLSYTFVFILIQLLVINIGFQFRHTGAPLNAYHFESRFFSKLQSFTPSFVQSVPLPLPYPYLDGLDHVKAIDELGTGNILNTESVTYLLGKTSPTGFPYYYPVVMLFKTPIPLLICIVLGLIIAIRQRSFWQREAYLVIPTLFFLIYLDLFYRSQVGLRHIMLVYPLLYILASRVALFFRRWWFWLLAIWQMASFYFYLPYLIPYTNELLLHKSRAYEIMADSNIDFKQGADALHNFLVLHPDYQYAPTQPAPGKYVIKLNHLLALNGDRRYQWLLAYQPSGHLVFTFVLYDIK